MGAEFWEQWHKKCLWLYNAYINSCFLTDNSLQLGAIYIQNSYREIGLLRVTILNLYNQE